MTNCFVTKRDIGESISHGITILTMHFLTAYENSVFRKKKSIVLDK